MIRKLALPTTAENESATHLLSRQLANRIAHSDAPVLAVITAAAQQICVQLRDLAAADDMGAVVHFRVKCDEMFNDAVASGKRRRGERGAEN